MPDFSGLIWLFYFSAAALGMAIGLLILAVLSIWLPITSTMLLIPAGLGAALFTYAFVTVK